MLAIISDIHSNVEALRAVLADIDAQGAIDIICLGDVVGYGPDPRACLDLVMRRCRVTVLGNHDLAAVYPPAGSGFKPSARRAIAWTCQQLAEAVPNRETAGRRLRFLGALPLWHEEGRLTFAHGSPCRDLANEYVFPYKAENLPTMLRLFAEFDRCCFVGHTHLPGVFVERGGGRVFEFRAPAPYRLDGEKALVNVGSVGQSRDGDWRACYVLLDGDVIRFRRVEYDVETTARKIESVLDLAGWLGERLREGR